MVGPHEVNLEFMQDAINKFKRGAPLINIGIVNYIEKELEVREVDVLIVGGIFFFLLRIGYEYFIERAYIDTKQV